MSKLSVYLFANPFSANNALDGITKTKLGDDFIFNNHTLRNINLLTDGETFNTSQADYSSWFY